MRIALVAVRSRAAATPALATDGPDGCGDNNGHAELSTDPHLMVASGRGGVGGEV